MQVRVSRTPGVYGSLLPRSLSRTMGERINTKVIMLIKQGEDWNQVCQHQRGCRNHHIAVSLDLQTEIAAQDYFWVLMLE